MGNGVSKPKNKTGKEIVRQKLENAGKIGVLSLQEHKLKNIPSQVFAISNLRTLDVSKNELTGLGNLSSLVNLKTLHCDENKLPSGSLVGVTKLKLQILTAGGNCLGKEYIAEGENVLISPLPEIPATIKQIKLDANDFSSFPSQLVSPTLLKLEKLDISMNNLASIPSEISNLKQLLELNLDNNSIVSLPNEIAQLQKLKTLSLRSNNIRGKGDFSPTNPQPLPAALFLQTAVVNLNLHGNPMTNSELNNFDGFDVFLERRKNVKTKNLHGGAMTQLDTCGLE